ncbi:MAG: murein biosynthesis integral membrane protein MurJ [Thermodesulfobacteriota bacterium]
MAHDQRSENRRVVRAAGTVGIATLISRVFGFIRDMVVAAFFGAGLTTDAFFVAFRIPNLLRRLLAEGSLTVSFVPVFTEYLRNKTREEAQELANITFTALSIILVAVSLLGVAFSPLIVKAMAPGFTRASDQYELAVFLTRIMFPYILLISLVALCMGILNSLRHFAAPALSPVILNLSMILAALTLRDLFREPVVALAVGVMAGGILQLAMQWPFLVKMGVRLRPSFRFRHPGLKRIGYLMAPAAFGAAIYQINVFIGTILASLLPPGSVSYLYYADRLVELPLGVFAIAVGTASLPSFSEQVALGKTEELKRTTAFSLRMILFVTIPATVAMIALRTPIISVLFQRGAFDIEATAHTAQALLFYTVGLWAFSTVRIIVAVFYALQDSRTPMKAAILALVVNTVFSVALMFPLKHAGIALATSIASAVNVGMLWVILKRRMGNILDGEYYRSVGRTVLASLVMGGVILAIEWIHPWNPSGPFDERLVYLVLCVSTGAAAFFAAAFLLKSPEMEAMGRVLRRRIASPPEDSTP